MGITKMTVAQTILSQIKALDSMAFFAWGAKDFVNMGDGLKFKTTGMVGWKGYVYVKYDEGKDLYNVIFAKIRKANWIVQKEVNGLYFDQLVEIINKQVQ
jgi:putative transposon-encoded protein